MSMMVDPYRFGSPSPTPFAALGYQASAGQGVSNTAPGTALTWDSEIFDVGSWHDTSSNTSRMTVPSSGVTYARAITNVANNGGTTLQHQIGGAAFQGQGKATVGNGSGNNAVNAASAIFAVSPSDYLESFCQSSGATVVANTWGMIEAIDPALKRALVKKTADQALSTGTTTTITWDAEDYDTDAFHDNSTNNSRLTAPATGRYRVIANLASDGNSGQFVLTFLKNGASARGLPAKDIQAAAFFLNAASAVLELTSGDYIEVQAFLTSAANVLTGVGTWFSMEEVPATYKCCTVYKSGTQAVSSGVTTALAFGAELYDDATMHDNVTNNSRIVVPAGCSYARPSFSIKTPSATGEQRGEVYMNGATYTGAPRYECDTSGTDSVSGIGAWVPVVPGDYFEVMFTGGAGMTLGTDDATWFCLECK